MNTKRNRRWLLALVLLLLLIGGGLGWNALPDKNLAAAKGLQKELFSPAATTLSSEERQEKWRALRDVSRKLSAAQRRELFSEMRKRRQADIAAYFKKSQAEKTRFLDEQIQRMQRMRPPGSQGASGRGGQGAKGSQASGGSATQSPRSGSTPASRDERRQERLDSTSPAERAQMAQFFHDLNARRAQLGLPAGRGFGPGR